jgi:hypothetical protein
MWRSRSASVGRSCPAWTSGTKVPTTAVLTTPAQKRAKALFCSKARRCSVPRATPRRQIISAQRLRVRQCHDLGRREKDVTRRDTVSTAAAGADAPPLSRRPRNGAGAGQSAKPCFSPVSPRRLRVPQWSARSARRRRRCSCASRCCVVTQPLLRDDLATPTSKSSRTAYIAPLTSAGVPLQADRQDSTIPVPEL